MVADRRGRGQPDHRAADRPSCKPQFADAIGNRFVDKACGLMLDGRSKRMIKAAKNIACGRTSGPRSRHGQEIRTTLCDFVARYRFSERDLSARTGFTKIAEGVNLPSSRSSWFAAGHRTIRARPGTIIVGVESLKGDCLVETALLLELLDHMRAAKCASRKLVDFAADFSGYNDAQNDPAMRGALGASAGRAEAAVEASSDVAAGATRLFVQAAHGFVAEHFKSIFAAPVRDAVELCLADLIIHGGVAPERAAALVSAVEALHRSFAPNKAMH